MILYLSHSVLIDSLTVKLGSEVKQASQFCRY